MLAYRGSFYSHDYAYNIRMTIFKFCVDDY
jgi:hypothetical protein